MKPNVTRKRKRVYDFSFKSRPARVNLPHEVIIDTYPLVTVEFYIVQFDVQNNRNKNYDYITDRCFRRNNLTIMSSNITVFLNLPKRYNLVSNSSRY